ncbi:MAG: hypothetical protein ABIQ15_17530 [Nocardioides sp.]
MRDEADVVAVDRPGEGALAPCSSWSAAFGVRLRLDVDGREEEGDLIVWVSPAGASAAIGFARDSCGNAS